MNFLSNRWIYLFACLICAILLTVGYYLQYAKDVSPCPLCMLQRLAFMGCGVIFLLAALHNPKSRLFQRFYGSLALLFVAAGIALALRHIWMQKHPDNAVQVCVPGYEYVLTNFPLSEAMSFFLKSAGNCGKVIPWWGLS